MKTQTIARRYGDEWVKQPNTDKYYCDECKKRLWIAPHGGIYCDTNECGKDYEYSHKTI